MISCHMIKIRKSAPQRTRSLIQGVVGLYQILACIVITSLEPLLDCQCYFKFWCCGYTFKTQHNQEINKKCIKDVGMARDDIKVKVNTQIPIPTTIYITVVL